MTFDRSLKVHKHIVLSNTANQILQGFTIFYVSAPNLQQKFPMQHFEKKSGRLTLISYSIKNIYKIKV